MNKFWLAGLSRYSRGLSCQNIPWVTKSRITRKYSIHVPGIFKAILFKIRELSSKSREYQILVANSKPRITRAVCIYYSGDCSKNGLKDYLRSKFLNGVSISWLSLALYDPVGANLLRWMTRIFGHRSKEYHFVHFCFVLHDSHVGFSSPSNVSSATNN